MRYPFLILALCLLPVTATAQTLTTAQIKQQIVGRNVCWQFLFREICIFHGRDGITKLDREPDLFQDKSDSGPHVVADNQLCATWKKSGTRACWSFVKTTAGYDMTINGRTLSVTVR